MKKIILGLFFVIVIGGYLISLKSTELERLPNFYALSKEAILINSEEMKVKCNYYVFLFGWIDEIEEEKKFQECINRHKINGYKIVESSGA